MSEAGHRWLKTWLPVAQSGGPFLTLGLAVVMCVSVWWFAGWLRECVDHNRELAAQLVTQQQAFHAEMRLSLVHCQPKP